MKKLNKKIVVILILSVFALFVSGDLCGANKKKKSSKKTKRTEQQATSNGKSDKYNEVFKDKKVKTCKGLFTLHMIENKIYFEFPVTLFGERMIMGTTVDAISDPSESTIGMQMAQPSYIVFDKEESSIMMRELEEINRSADSQFNESLSLSKSNISPIVAAFPIIAYTSDSSAVLIETTSLFTKNEKAYNPIDKMSFAGQGGIVRSAKPDDSGNMPIDIYAYEDNISVLSMFNFSVDSYMLMFPLETEKPLTALFKRTLLLPQKESMKPRIADSRIGTDFVSYREFSDQEQRVKRRYLSKRWRIEPTNVSAVLNGGLSEVKKPIVFHLDPNLPKHWITAIKGSIRKWNKAFEKIGLENVIQLTEFNENDSLFDTNNIKYSTIRYVLTPGSDIRDNTLVDPLTGEIISANIFISYGVEGAIQTERLMQTSANDKRVRGMDIPRDLVVETLEAKLLRSIGSCLGLRENPAASFAYSPDSLKSAPFTKRYGISPSVMDELPYNTMINESEFLSGVELLQKDLGVYDYYVIKWLYGVISENLDWKEEIPFLESLISENISDPRFRFSQIHKARYDPSVRSGDLGNDHIVAADFAFENLKKVINNVNEWVGDEDYDYKYRSDIFAEIFDRLWYHFNNVLANVGGVYMYEKLEGDPIPAYKPVARKTQKESLQWILSCYTNMGWADNKKFNDNVGTVGSISTYLRQHFFLAEIFKNIKKISVSEDKMANTYTQEEAMTDASNFIWEKSKLGEKLTEPIKELQEFFIGHLIGWSKIHMPPMPNRAFQHYELTSRKSESSSLVMENDYQGMLPLEAIPYEVPSNKEHLWYGMLKDTRSIIASAKSRTSDADDRIYYSWLLLKVDQALSNK